MAEGTEADFLNVIARKKGLNFAVASWLVKNHISRSNAQNLSGDTIGNMLQTTLEKINELSPKQSKSQGDQG